MDQPQKPKISPLLIGGPPWEKKHDLGFFVAFVETIKGFLMHPGETFSVMRRQAGLGDALIYTVALQVFAFLWVLAVNGNDLSRLLPQDPEFQSLLQLPENFSQTLVVLYPLMVILMQFVSASALHLALKWRNLQSYDFNLIFRMLAYSSGSAALLTIIPVLGSLLTSIMMVYLVYTGIQTIYGIRNGSFILTALLAFVIAIGIYFLLIIPLTILLLLLLPA
jgi:hypothetical protein